MIFEQQIFTDSANDVMQGGRLSNIPYNGALALQFQAQQLSEANNWRMTIQLPNGDVPLDNQLISAGADVPGCLDSDTLTQMTFNATQGGHFTIGVTKTGGANVLIARFVLMP